MDRRAFVRAAALPAVLALPGIARAAAPGGAAEKFFQQHLGDLPGELRQAAKDGKRGMLLVFEMEGCPFCEWLHREALRVPEVQGFYRRHFVALRIDVRGATPITGFDGRERTESAFATSQKVAGTPTSIFYDLQGKEVARFPGAPRDRREYLLLGEFVSEGHYRTATFRAFRDSRAGR